MMLDPGGRTMRKVHGFIYLHIPTNGLVDVFDLVLLISVAVILLAVRFKMHVSSLLCAGFAAAAPAKDQPYVDLGYAQYVGSRLPSGVDQFLGIRYAKPPVGNLRFKAPQDPIQTCGVQNATQVINSPIETTTERIQLS